MFVCEYKSQKPTTVLVTSPYNYTRGEENCNFCCSWVFLESPGPQGVPRWGAHLLPTPQWRFTHVNVQF